MVKENSYRLIKINNSGLSSPVSNPSDRYYENIRIAVIVNIIILLQREEEIAYKDQTQSWIILGKYTQPFIYPVSQREWFISLILGIRK